MNNRFFHSLLNRESVLFGALFFCALLPRLAFAGEGISAYTAHIEIRGDTSISVQEEIVYNFGDSPDRHGILRYIPLTYRIPGEVSDRSIDITDLLVTDGLGNLRPVKYDGGGNFVSLKVGEPEVTVKGEQLYVIHYTVRGAIVSLPEKDELYWNVTGHDWSVPIDRVRAEVVLPAPFREETISAWCYVGEVGSTRACAKKTITPGTQANSTKMIRYEDQSLLSHHGLSVAVGIPKGALYFSPVTSLKKRVDHYPGRVVRWWNNPSPDASLVLPLLVFLLMFRVWWKRGRDPKGSGVIIAEYDTPDGLSPIRCSALHTGRVSADALSAEIIFLAIRGFIKIERIREKGLLFDGTDYRLVKLREPDGTISSADRLILEGLFQEEKVLVSDLRSTLQPLMAPAEKTVWDDLTSLGYYAENPRSAMVNYAIVGFIVLLFGFFIPAFNMSVTLSGIFIILFAFLMPKVTEKGARTKERLLGFREYLNTAEKDRINFANAPETDPDMFERFLPYAMVFGVEKVWATQFEGMFAPNDPVWYSGGGAPFAPHSFVADMRTFSASTATAFASHGGASGGGGFSGGGVGGGGGRSW